MKGNDGVLRVIVPQKWGSGSGQLDPVNRHEMQRVGFSFLNALEDIFSFLLHDGIYLHVCAKKI